MSESKSPADNDTEGVDELAALREAHVRSAASAIDKLGSARDRWDDESKLEETLKSEAGQRAGKLLLDDEKEFIDLENSPIWFAYEYPQINPTPENVIAEAGSNIKKVFFPLRHKSYLDEAEARKYWLTHHGPIVRAHGHEAGILCYRQVHRLSLIHISEPTRPY